jgi:hypothetical protein
MTRLAVLNHQSLQKGKAEKLSRQAACILLADAQRTRPQNQLIH